jgi:integrase
VELTDAAIRKLKPRSQRREVPDDKANGLYLVIQPSGAKSFAMRFRRPDGKSAKLTLGPLEDSGVEPTDDPEIGAPLTLAMARQLAARIHRERKRGVDVVGETKARKERNRIDQQDRAANTFAVAVRRFCDAHKPARDHRLKHWRYVAKVLGIDYPLEGGKPSLVAGGLADMWGDKPLATIDDHDIHVAVREARDRGIPGMGRRNKAKSEARARSVHSALSLLFKWALDERFDRDTKNNPCRLVSRPGQAASRDRVLSDAEIRTFWAATDQIGEPFAALNKLLLLTGCRREEVAGMRWSELSDDRSTWTIPSSRTKNWREHVVPLPPLAREIIASVPRVEGDFVFTTTGRSFFSGFSRVKQRLDALMDGAPPWRLHDLRRSCARLGQARRSAARRGKCVEPRQRVKGGRRRSLQQVPIFGREDGSVDDVGISYRGAGQREGKQCRSPAWAVTC